MAIKIETQISNYEVVKETKDTQHGEQEYVVPELPLDGSSDQTPVNVVHMHE